MVALWSHHRAATEYDLQTRVGWGFEELRSGRRGWREVWWIVSEILRDPYSHIQHSLAGSRFVPTPTDVGFFNWLDARQQMARGKGQIAPPPVERPWVGVREYTPRADPDRARRRAFLRERLGLNF